MPWLIYYVVAMGVMLYCIHDIRTVTTRWHLGPRGPSTVNVQVCLDHKPTNTSRSYQCHVHPPSLLFFLIFFTHVGEPTSYPCHPSRTCRVLDSGPCFLPPRRSTARLWSSRKS